MSETEGKDNGHGEGEGGGEERGREGCYKLVEETLILFRAAG
jgi:hypothetical protein